MLEAPERSTLKMNVSVLASKAGQSTAKQLPFVPA
jgi:hypothetical protein